MIVDLRASGGTSSSGNRALVEVLLSHRHMARNDVLAALRAVTSVGATSPDIVAVEARRIAEHRAAEERDSGLDVADPNTESIGPGRVVSLTERRLVVPNASVAVLPADPRPLPSIAAYDQLLARRRTPPSSGGSHAAAATAIPSTTGEVS